MVTKTVKLTNEDGLHARAAALFVRVANNFNSEITLQAHGDTVNGKSIIGVMSLGVFNGEEVVLTALGSDEQEAIDKLVELVENKFINRY
ncbi:MULTISPECIES: HPr family phosphocarrier protein [Peptoniphilus]|uniref:HPr family phosphocarrier protein n=1 Tax=Peptoniphilus TaxID=162289 RepID=UPI0001DA9ACF|nr:MULTISPECIES: HPr family phosphocarrier protein [Peptoniphilus]EFI42025.1 putative phosphocarrier protein HPr [Peptoniphilus sp. oral taxon 386 str. F0131]